MFISLINLLLELIIQKQYYMLCMESLNVYSVAFFVLLISACNAANSKLFREYIGAESVSIKLTDIPINPNVEVHIILAFAIDYTDENSPSPTDGKFNVFWETGNLGPNQIASTKDSHKNVKIAVSLGGDSVGNGKAYFRPKSITSWVNNAVSSLTSLIKTYHIDGIDIDYENFKTDPNTFAECFGQLITTLKKSRTISFASIAPYEDGEIQSHYMALWRKYGHVIDYVNFQFYAYDKGTSVSQFVQFFNKQASNYRVGRILASFISNGNGCLAPNSGFFEACNELRVKENLEVSLCGALMNLKSMGFNTKRNLKSC